MTNEGAAEKFDLEESKLFFEAAKFFREHVQAVLNLATGSLVLSVTFLHNLGSNLVNKQYLRWSWMLFICTILLGIAYNYVLGIHVRIEGRCFARVLFAISTIFHLSFLVAVYYLARFGLSNL